MRVRTYGKNIMESKISTTMPVLKETQFIIRKWKVPILSANGMYQMAAIPHAGLNVGECSDVNTVIGYMKKCGVLIKGDKPGVWNCLGDTYKTLEPIKEKLVVDKVWGLAVRANVIKTMLAGGEIAPQDEGEAD